MKVQYAIRSYGSLMSQLRAKSGSGDLMVMAVDGCGAAGKTTFARKFARWAGNAPLVHMDDFYKPSAARQDGTDASAVGALLDWRRLEREVLGPLSTGRCARYQRYDWQSDALAEWHDLSPTGLVIVEGVSSARLELASYYSLIVWLKAPEDQRLSRGIARDGEASRALWEQEWMPAEERYVRAHCPLQRADVVVDGSGKIDHDADSEAVSIVP